MGTTRYTYGEIIFDPPLQANELRLPELAPFLDGSRAVLLVVYEKTFEVDDGTLVCRFSDVIQPTHESDDAGSGYVNRYLPEHLVELVDIIAGMADPNYGDHRSFSHVKHIEVCAGAYSAADFEAYRLTVGTAAGRPAVYRTDATVVWGDKPVRTIWKSDRAGDVARS